MYQNVQMNPTSLTERITVRVRFDEVDSLGIVWHGNYVKYLEDGREAWGRKFGIPYMTLYHTHGYAVPLVKLNMDFKQPLKYDDVFTVETRYVDCPAAKLILHYTIYNAHEEVVLTAESVQVFLSKETNQMELNVPDFFCAWKQIFLSS
jgi:acyl-CoA thioester hydrolase